MNRAPRFFLGAIAVATLSVVIAGQATTPAPKSVWTGVYTDAQAASGEETYYQQCALCHGEDLGGVEQAPALVGPAFNDRWNGATLKKLYDRLETMPVQAPKSLTAKQYTDLLAFLLSVSEVPSGATPLPSDGAVLAEITFNSEAPKTSEAPKSDAPTH